MNTKVKISTLWIVVMLNMAFADILSHASGKAGGNNDRVRGSNFRHPGINAGIRHINRDSYRYDYPFPGIEVQGKPLG